LFSTDFVLQLNYTSKGDAIPYVLDIFLKLFIDTLRKTASVDKSTGLNSLELQYGSKENTIVSLFFSYLLGSLALFFILLSQYWKFVNIFSFSLYRYYNGIVG